MPTPGTSRSVSPSPPVKKKAKIETAMGEGEKALLQSLKEIQETARGRRTQKEDMDANFALEVAGRLRRLPPKQNAYAKLQIQQLLFSIEFHQESAEPAYQVNSYQY